ncbi:unnamed protein product [Staurois parvus]|uniref:Uncharacterized protein n=1 Tax=Staurois parvus TaxID=386267 RepID=A0ABN9C6W5_9NEOB|nr:unnamed protein product [Staurois parvus]
MGPPTDPRPSGSARVSKWSVCPCLRANPCPFCLYLTVLTEVQLY